MRGVTKEFYPMNIFTSRYNGTYSGGAYILIAGVYNPRQDTNAAATDTECMDFWKTVEEEGPVIETNINGESKEIYADSGQHPSVLFQKYEEFCRDRVQRRVATIVTKVLRDYPEISVDARENIVDLHKLTFVAKGWYGQDVGSNHISEELTNRFLEYESIPSPQKLSDEELEELEEFIDSIDEDLRTPIEYA